MTVYFLRHGIAERQSADGDRGRRLTEEGKHELRKVLQLARIKPALVLSSPYVRAKETAEIAVHELELTEQPLFSGALAPHSRPIELWDEIRTHAGDSVLIVAHEPLLSTAIAWVLGSSKSMIQFPPAGLAAVDFESAGPAPAGILRWMITPGIAAQSF